MPNLTETAHKARQVIKFGGFGFVGLLFIWLVGSNAIRIWRVVNPAPPPPPSEDFGKLEPINFPESKQLNYDLQTPTGEIEEFTTQIKVFYSPALRSSFLDAERATELARMLGFLFEPEHPSEGTLRWQKSDPVPMTLKVELATTNFTLNKQWQAAPRLLEDKRFISEQQSIIDAQSFLRSAGVMKSDLSGNEKVSYYKANNNQLVSALSLSEADFVRVDFFRQTYQELDENDEVIVEHEFFSIKPNEGLSWVMLSGSRETDLKVIKAEYNYRPIEYDESGIYGLKSAVQAWEELQSGEGYVARYNGVGTAVVRRIKLGYLEPIEGSEYTKPVYVFTGDEGLVAYVSALEEGE